MIKSIAVKSVRKAQSSELVKRAQCSSSLSLRKAQSKELAGAIGQVVKKKLAESSANDGGVLEALANGAVDVIVVQSSDGKLSSTPWYGQIGKVNSIFKSRTGNEVGVFVNSVPARVRMTVCESGNLSFENSSCGSDNQLSHENLKELNLKPGENKARYVCPELNINFHFSVFFYNSTDKLIISDVDGTITKSDIKGHVLPKLGISAHHTGVVELFHKLESRGYKIIYLTARPCAMDDGTKNYLFNTIQEANPPSLPPGIYHLPAGPLLLSPTNFIAGLITEVVTGRPDEMKTSLIRKVWGIFKEQEGKEIGETIVAAYGNKETDVKAYSNCGLPKEKMYIVNTYGELKNMGSGVVSSYQEQAAGIDSIFPKLKPRLLNHQYPT